MSEWNRGRQGGPGGQRGPHVDDDAAQESEHPLRALHADPRVARMLYRRRVQRKANNAAGKGAARIPQSDGVPLPGDVRARMEPQLGADLSGVKVHTGGDSERAAEQMGARAFAVGSDVHFGAGQFSPGSKEGDRLLAHELTHTVQADRSGVQRKAEEPAGAMPADAGHEAAGAAHEGEAGHEAGGAAHGEAGDAAHAGGLEAAGEGHEVSHPNDAAEVEADHVADQAAEGLHGAAGGEKGAAAGGGAKAKPAAISAKLYGAGRMVFRSATPAEQQKPGMWSRVKGALGGGKEADPKPAPQKLDPGVYKPMSKQLDGTAPKTVLVDGSGGMFVFKPSANALPHEEGTKLGIEPTQYGRRSVAAGVVAKQVGLETPGVRIVEYMGKVGSLQPWRAGGKTMAQIRDEQGQEVAEAIQQSPEYQRARADINVFDYLINNLDRNPGNYIMDFDARGKVEKIVPIDHDLTFTKTKDRPPVDFWHAGLPDHYSDKMVEHIKHMDANRSDLKKALEHVLAKSEIAGVLHRLDEIVKDVKTKAKTKKA